MFWILAFTVMQHNPVEILTRIDQILAEDSRFEAFPPSRAKKVVIRVFKLEGEAEIWAGDSQLQLVAKLDICAVDRNPGPKLREGDGKTPEGFYTLNFEHGFYSKMWFMWIDLNNPEKEGEVGTGSVFKTFVTYPENLDLKHTAMAGLKNAGGAIFCHGNCVTAGCVSFKNRDYLPIFSYTRHAFLQGKQNAQIHVFPFRFDQKNIDDMAAKHARTCGQRNRWCSHVTAGFWRELEKGFLTFNQKPRLLNHSYRDLEMKMGDRGPQIKSLCRRLGLGEGDIFNAELQTMLKGFQREKGLQVNGVVGPKTLQALEMYPFTYSFE